MMDKIEGTILCIKLFTIFFSSVALHEFGHYIYFKKAIKKNVDVFIQYKKPLKIFLQTGTADDYKSLTDKQFIMVNFCGIAVGLLPIVVAAYFNWFYFMMLLPYAWGVIPDVANISKTFATTTEQIFEDEDIEE